MKYASATAQTTSSGTTHWEGAYHTRDHSSKSNWAGISLADAFRMNLPYHVRTPALRLFYRQVHRAQQQVARQIGKNTSGEHKPAVEPQLSPCYTTYPLTLAVPAAIGQTAFLEYQAMVKMGALRVRLRRYLQDPAQADQVRVDSAVYAKVAQIVTDLVESRLLLESLADGGGLSSIEIYRLFCAAQFRLDFVSLPDILRAVILYGDVLPDYRDLRLHPLTQKILQELIAISERAWSGFTRSFKPALALVGEKWVRSTCRCLAPYLPSSKPVPVVSEPNDGPELELDLDLASPQPQKLQMPHPNSKANDKVAPLKGPHPPVLFDAEQPQQDLQQLLDDAAKKTEQETDAFADFAQTVEQAGGQSREWEDMRSDLLERALGLRPFKTGPIQGHQAIGHEVEVDLGDKTAQAGEIFDCALGLSDDLLAHDRLMAASQPIIAALRRNLYPNLCQIPRVRRLKTSGSFDPSRLALAEISSTIFRRYRIHRQAERKGRPLVAIAADGSGSLNPDQMYMLKCLSLGWLMSTMGSEIQMLAGLYHSGKIREGTNGPLVQWMYHPHKTPAFSRREAARAIVSLPDHGTGVQSDALSLSFILDEAQALARRNMIYLVLLTDCAWNRSFTGRRSGQQEVLDLFIQRQKLMDEQLHTTLVGLGVEDRTGVEEAISDIVRVSAAELKDPSLVAQKIGTHVACKLKNHSHLRYTG